MIVVDVGCHDHPAHDGQSQDSIGRLIDRFRPRVLYGFDPHPGLPVGSTLQDGVRVVRERRAAWVHDGIVEFDYTPDQGPLGSKIREGAAGRVPCFDLAAFLIEQLPQGHIVLKLDAEGAEYPLLARIIDQDVDEFLTLVLVEWHQPRKWQARRRLERALRCPVQPW